MRYLLALVVAFACVGKVANAQPFSHSANLAVHPDHRSGEAFGMGIGRNAVTTSISSGITYWLDGSSNLFHFSTYLVASGYWGEVGQSSFYYDILSTSGLTNHSQTDLSILTYNGSYYELDVPVFIVLDGFANIYTFNAGSTTILEGTVRSDVNAVGAIPIQSTSYVRFVENNNVPVTSDDWIVTFSSEWVIPSGFSPIPAPSTALFLGLVGLFATRRHR